MSPKSGWSLRPELAPVEFSQAALCELTGSRVMSVFQTLLAGKTLHVVPGILAAATATELGRAGASSRPAWKEGAPGSAPASRASTARAAMTADPISISNDGAARADLAAARA